MNTTLFIVSHIGSGSNFFADSLNLNSRIQVYDTEINYNSPHDLFKLTSQSHKLDTSASIYCEQLLFNYRFSCKQLHSLCKFIYIIGNVKSSLSEMMKFYPVKTASLYYRYRLNRIYEMIKRTPSAIFLTQKDLQFGKLEIIEKYLGLKEPLKKPIMNYSDDEVDYKTYVECQEVYERYLHKISLIVKSLSTNIGTSKPVFSS